MIVLLGTSTTVLLLLPTTGANIMSISGFFGHGAGDIMSISRFFGRVKPFFLLAGLNRKNQMASDILRVPQT